MLTFVPVASAMAGVHREYLVLASNFNGQRYSLLYLKALGNLAQITSKSSEKSTSDHERIFCYGGQIVTLH